MLPSLYSFGGVVVLGTAIILISPVFWAAAQYCARKAVSRPAFRPNGRSTSITSSSFASSAMAAFNSFRNAIALLWSLLLLPAAMAAFTASTHCMSAGVKIGAGLTCWLVQSIFQALA